MKNTLKDNAENLLFLKDLVIDSYSNNWTIDKFIVFKSFNNILYLIYSNNNKSIISYNIIDNKKINEIKNAHIEYISCFRYYFDNTNKRDLVISLSSNLHYSNIKLWDINNLELILNIEKLTNYGFLKSACFLNDNKGGSYIVTCFTMHYKKNPEPIKVYDFKGNKTKEINDSEDSAYYIDNYYDDNLNKNFILTGNIGYIKSYDYNENKIYHKYYENSENNFGHLSIIINKKKEITELIESCPDGNIRIWNFHSGVFIRIINISKEGIRDICMWDNEYLLVGCDDKTIKLINLNNGEIIKEMEGHNNKVLSLKIINHPIYGKCLLSQGADFEPIKLWIIKK